MKLQLKDFLLYLLILVVAIIGVIFIFSANNSSQNEIQDLPKEGTESAMVRTKQYTSLPKMEISPDKKYQATIITTKGLIKIDLFAKDTPIAVNNFVFLTKEGFYNGTIFHRVIKGFMIQGGDPSGDGSGGPGYTFPDEKIKEDYKRGIVAMANSGSNTNGSQFFIMHKDYNLPKQYVIFGRVVEGIETVDKIAEVQTTDNGAEEKSRPVEEIKIDKIEIKEE